MTAGQQGTGDELAQLRRRNAELEQLVQAVARLSLNGHGEPAPPELAAEVTRLGIREYTQLQARRWASRQAAAQDWHEPQTADLAAELAMPRQNLAHRITGLAGWNHNILLSGPRKLGKSQLAVNLAAALSLSAAWTAHSKSWTPAPFLGLGQCLAGGSVAYVNAEMDADDWRDTFRALPGGSWHPEHNPRGIYDSSRIHPLHCRGLPFPVIVNETARRWFTGWLCSRGVETLIIDTWGAFCNKNGVRNYNDDGDVRPVLDGLDAIKRDAGVASLLVVIHTPHQQPGAAHLERFKGAGAVGDWADVLWRYVADDEGTRYLSAIGRARIDREEAALHFDHQTGLLSWGMTGSRAQTAAERQRQAVRDELGKAGADGMATEQLLYAVGGHRASMRNLVKKMAADGDLESRTEGRTVVYFLPGFSRPAG